MQNTASKLQEIIRDLDSELTWLCRTYFSVSTPRFVQALQTVLRSREMLNFIQYIRNNSLFMLAALPTSFVRLLMDNITFLQVQNRTLLENLLYSNISLLPVNRQRAAAQLPANRGDAILQLASDPEIGIWLAVRLARIFERILLRHRDIIDILYVDDMPDRISQRLPAREVALQQYDAIFELLNQDWRYFVARPLGWFAENKGKVVGGVVAGLGFMWWVSRTEADATPATQPNTTLLARNLSK